MAKIGNKSDPRTNGSGYFDPTAYEAVKNVSKDEARFNKLLRTIFGICELAGFEVKERIVLMDRKTGKIWR